MHFAHAPLQEFGDMLIKSIWNRIKRCEGKRICACCWVALLGSVSARVAVSTRRIVSGISAFKPRASADWSVLNLTGEITKTRGNFHFYM